MVVPRNSPTISLINRTKIKLLVSKEPHFSENILQPKLNHRVNTEVGRELDPNP